LYYNNNKDIIINKKGIIVLFKGQNLI
jgi:hypothetical protein